MYVKSLDELNPTDRSEEIKHLAQAFQNAVVNGTVYEPGGYALKSNLRDLDISTSTAPVSLQGSMDILVRDLNKGKESDSARIARNLESAVATLTVTESFLKSGHARMPKSDTDSLLNNVGLALPGMRKIVNTMKNG